MLERIERKGGICPPSPWLNVGVRDMLPFSLLSDDLFYASNHTQSAIWT